jgi:hypothetical protein
MNIMSCRYDWLVCLIAALDKIKIPFIGFDGNKFVPCGISDDLGLFYFVPQLVRWFDVSLDSAINIFLYSLIFIPASIALISFFKLYTDFWQRLIVILGMLQIIYCTIIVGDVYVAYSASVMAGVPFTLWINQKKNIGYRIGVLFFLVGLFLGLMHTVRAFSCLPPIVFMFILIMGHACWQMRYKVCILAMLCMGLMVIPGYFSYLFKTYEEYAFSHQLTDKKISSKHIIWHSIYLGLGFLNNDFGIRYDDGVGERKAISIDPTAVYPSRRYEEVIKAEVIRICKEDKGFVLRTVFAKLGVIIFYLFRYGGILGLLAAFFYPKIFSIELVFFIAFGLSSLFGILVMPLIYYLLGFISLSLIYSIFSINYVLSKRPKHLKRFIFNTSNQLTTAGCNKTVFPILFLLLGSIQLILKI